MRPRLHSLRLYGIPVLLTLIVGVGCHTTEPDRVKHPAPEHFAKIDAAMMQVLNRSSIDAAIVEQHTLYPYHFVRNSSELNDLGRRDLSILLTHYREFAHRGTTPTLNISQAQTPDSLYEARVQRVAQMIADAGIEADRIEVTDGMPGGDGVRSERAIRILETEHRAATEGRRPLDTGARTGIGIGGR